MDLNVAPDQPALVVNHIMKRFNVASDPWWRRLTGRIPDKGASSNGDAAPALKAKRGKTIVTAVDDVSFAVQRREIFGVLVLQPQIAQQEHLRGRTS